MLWWPSHITGNWQTKNKALLTSSRSPVDVFFVTEGRFPETHVSEHTFWKVVEENGIKDMKKELFWTIRRHWSVWECEMTGLKIYFDMDVKLKDSHPNSFIFPEPHCPDRPYFEGTNNSTVRCNNPEYQSHRQIEVSWQSLSARVCVSASKGPRSPLGEGNYRSCDLHERPGSGVVVADERLLGRMTDPSVAGVISGKWMNKS